MLTAREKETGHTRAVLRVPLQPRESGSAKPTKEGTQNHGVASGKTKRKRKSMEESGRDSVGDGMTKGGGNLHVVIRKEDRPGGQRRLQQKGGAKRRCGRFEKGW